MFTILYLFVNFCEQFSKLGYPSTLIQNLKKNRKSVKFIYHIFPHSLLFNNMIYEFGGISIIKIADNSFKYGHFHYVF